MEKHQNDIIYEHWKLFLAFILASSAILIIINAYSNTPLVDYSYTTEISYRILCGQIPYRDFILVLPPGVFYLTVLFWQIFGISQWATIFGVAICYILGELFLFDLIHIITEDIKMTLILMIHIIFSGYALVYSGVFSYDISETFAVVLSIDLFMRSIKSGKAYYFLLLGLSVFFTLIFKQNTGITFFILLFCIMLASLLYHKIDKFNFFIFLIGVSISILIIASWVLYYQVWDDIVWQMFQHPAKVRNVFKTLGATVKSFFHISYILNVLSTLVLFYSLCRFYKLREKRANGDVITVQCAATSMIWSFVVLPSIFILLFHTNTNWSYTYHWHTLIILYFAFILSDLNKTKKIEFTHVCYLAILLYVVSNFTSQGISGSTYGIYPILSIMIGTMYAQQFFLVTNKKVITILVMCISINLIVICATGGRMSYVDQSGDLYRTKIERLSPISVRGEFLQDFEELADWIKSNVSDEETFISIPGEDPIYFSTGRYPALTYFQLEKTTFPYLVEDIYKDCVNNNICYIFIKQKLQCKAFNDISKIYGIIGKSYVRYAKIKNYEIYRKK